MSSQKKGCSKGGHSLTRAMAIISVQINLMTRKILVLQQMCKCEELHLPDSWPHSTSKSWNYTEERERRTSESALRNRKNITFIAFKIIKQNWTLSEYATLLRVKPFLKRIYNPGNQNMAMTNDNAGHSDYLFHVQRGILSNTGKITCKHLASVSRKGKYFVNSY